MFMCRFIGSIYSKHSFPGCVYHRLEKHIWECMWWHCIALPMFTSILMPIQTENINVQ